MFGVLFPGQGSQHIGMGKFLYDEFAVAKEAFEEASDTLSIDFKKLCFSGPESDLALTHNTQPALLLASTATYRVLQEVVDFKPSAGAGHSVGEYAAAVNSGALSFTDGLRLVRLRGEQMQKAVPVGEGGMVAVIGLEDDKVQELCTWAQNESGVAPIEPANFNAPGQVVVSGRATLLEWTRDHFRPEVIGCEGKKVRMIPLKVSAPFHCSMMAPAEKEMAGALQEVRFQEAQWPIVQNVTGEMVVAADQLRQNLVSQITGAVKWTQCVTTLQKQDLSRFVECGPGKVLSGLNKKIDGNLPPCFAMQSLEDLKTFEQEIS